MQCNTIQYYKIAYTTFQTKIEHYWPKKGPFWPIGAEGIQSYLRTWDSYDPIELGMSKAERGGYMGDGLSAEKKLIFGPKMHFFLAQNPFF